MFLLSNAALFLSPNVPNQSTVRKTCRPYRHVALHALDAQIFDEVTCFFLMGPPCRSHESNATDLNIAPSLWDLKSNVMT